jgi:hypothetical protein
MMPMIYPLDNDAIHIKEHTRFFLSQELEDYAKENNGIKRYVLQHINMHKQAQVQKAMEEGQRLQAMQPQPIIQQNMGQPAM